jgi:hypothetical protein
LGVNTSLGDHVSLKPSGEEGDPLVAVDELLGSRFGAEPKAETCKAHGDYVEDRLGRIRKDGS